MADNSTQTGSDTIATDDLATLNGGASSGVKVQRAKVGYGSDGDYRDVDATYRLPVEAMSPALSATSGAISAGATGTVGPADVSRAGNVSFIVRNTVAGSAWAGTPVLVFEQSDDNTSWAPLLVVRSDTGQAGGSFTLGAGAANASLVFEAGVEAVNYVRCRVTTGPTTNGLTINIQAGSLAFIQGSSVIAVPTDGGKWTYSQNFGTSSPLTTHTTGTFSFLEIVNTGTTRLMRVQRVRLELTATTAALATFAVRKRSAPSSTGTAGTIGSVGPHDTGSPAATGLAKVFTVAPSANGGLSLADIAQRRVWAPLNTATTGPGIAELTFGNRPAQAVMLRPNEVLSVYWVVAPAGPTLSGEVEWTEEPI